LVLKLTDSTTETSKSNTGIYSENHATVLGQTDFSCHLHAQATPENNTKEQTQDQLKITSHPDFYKTVLPHMIVNAAILRDQLLTLL